MTYDALDTRVGKVDSGGTKTYRRDGVGVTAPVLNDGVSAFTPGISLHNGGASKFLHGDRVGTFAHETDASQNTTATKQYDAFGNLTISSGASAGPFGFAGGWGYQEDQDGGLKLLGHRYYDPSTGRFLTRDPAEDGRNWYAYCDDNPLRGVDPTGLSELDSLIRAQNMPLLLEFIEENTLSEQEMQLALRCITQAIGRQLVSSLVKGVIIYFTKHFVEKLVERALGDDTAAKLRWMQKTFENSTWFWNRATHQWVLWNGHEHTIMIIDEQGNLITLMTNQTNPGRKEDKTQWDCVPVDKGDAVKDIGDHQ